MGSEWTDTLLEELADEVTVGFVGSMTSEYVDDGIPFFRSKNVNPYKLNWDDIKYVSREFHEKIKKSSLGPGDVVIVRTGKPGTACMIPDEVTEANCSDLVIVRPGSNLDKRFLVYFLNSAASHHIHANLVGAVQQHFNVGAAKKLNIPLPPLPEQKAIAHILGTLDDKIELNRRMNATLEGMAQALFKSWFVDFDPVIDNALAAGNSIPDELAPRAEVRKKALAKGTTQQGSLDHPTPYPNIGNLFPSSFRETEEIGWIPEGWPLDSIYSLIDVIYGAPFKSSKFTAEGEGTPVIRIRDLKTGKPQNWTEEDHPKKTLISTGDIVVGMDAEFRATIWPGREAYLNQRLFLAKPKVKAANSFFIQKTLGPLLEFEENTQVGTTVAHLGKKEIDRFEALIPSESVLDLYAQTTDPLLSRLINNLKATANLTKLRDTLLPKLISGELRLSEAEQLTEEALT